MTTNQAPMAWAKEVEEEPVEKPSSAVSKLSAILMVVLVSAIGVVKCQRDEVRQVFGENSKQSHQDECN